MCCALLFHQKILQNHEEEIFSSESQNSEGQIQFKRYEERNVCWVGVSRSCMGLKGGWGFISRMLKSGRTMPSGFYAANSDIM